MSDLIDGLEKAEDKRIDSYLCSILQKIYYLEARILITLQ